VNSSIGAVVPRIKEEVEEFFNKSYGKRKIKRTVSKE
jgi:hypothetical protein